MRRLSQSLAALAACACLGQGLAAAEVDQPSAQYQEERKALEEMLSSRQLDLFELQFIPGKLDRIVVRDRRGVDHVYNYLTFAIRNQAVADAAQMATRAKGYNEVLQAITKEYEKAKIDSEGGVKLTIDGVAGPDGVVLERTESKLRTRTVSVTALATNENGTRIRLLDEPPGSGPQEQYAFPDLGEPTWSAVVDHIHEKVEEKEGRKLLSTQALRSYTLPPFDGVTRVEAPDITDPAHDTHGWLVGEAHGVLLFPRLSDHGDRFTVYVNGLCNKIRFRQTESTAGKPDNYFKMRTLRRTMVLQFSRPGDEFFRDLDRFDLVRHGYAWADSFQRTAVRRTAAYARYFLANVADEKGNPNGALIGEFWPYYDELRSANGRLPDLKPGAEQK